MSKIKKKIGTRGSKLALWQANFVKDFLEKTYHEIEIELVIIKTEGDQRLDIPLSEIGGKGLFIKELEDALLSKKVDLAVHSLKDMTTQISEELVLSAVTKREDPRDCLITFAGKKLEELDKGSVIGTSSLRRKAQILNLHPDLIVKTLRGNLDTRMKKLNNHEFDGFIAACAGVKRLNLENKISQYLPIDIFIPSAGQGVLGIETRVDDKETCDLVNVLNDEETKYCITAERAFLKKLEGSCKAPIAAHAVIVNSQIKLTGMVASIDGKIIIKDTLKGSREDAEKIGTDLGFILYNNGADRILKEILGEI